MYKVFFNGSTIQIASGENKSSKNNMARIIQYDGYNSVDQIIGEIELGNQSTDFIIVYPETDHIWTQFKSYFKEIRAAGGLVQNSEGSFLFIRRLAVWDLPKGKIEKHETPENSAIREVEEECGLTNLKIIRPLDSTFHIYRSHYLSFPKNLVLKETKWFLMNYSGNETPKPQVEEDIEEVRWFAVSELSIPLSDTYRSLSEFLDTNLQKR